MSNRKKEVQVEYEMAERVHHWEQRWINVKKGDKSQEVRLQLLKWVKTKKMTVQPRGPRHPHLRPIASAKDWAATSTLPPQTLEELHEQLQSGQMSLDESGMPSGLEGLLREVMAAQAAAGQQRQGQTSKQQQQGAASAATKQEQPFIDLTQPDGGLAGLKQEPSQGLPLQLDLGSDPGAAALQQPPHHPSQLSQAQQSTFPGLNLAALPAQGSQQQQQAQQSQQALQRPMDLSSAQLSQLQLPVMMDLSQGGAAAGTPSLTHQATHQQQQQNQQLPGISLQLGAGAATPGFGMPQQPGQGGNAGLPGNAAALLMDGLPILPAPGMDGLPVMSATAPNTTGGPGGQLQHQQQAPGFFPGF